MVNPCCGALILVVFWRRRRRKILFLLEWIWLPLSAQGSSDLPSSYRASLWVGVKQPLPVDSCQEALLTESPSGVGNRFFSAKTRVILPNFLFASFQDFFFTSLQVNQTFQILASGQVPLLYSFSSSVAYFLDYKFLFTQQGLTENTVVSVPETCFLQTATFLKWLLPKWKLPLLLMQPLMLSLLISN